MNNAELIVRTLREAGVSHGFGIPSGNVLPLLEAMRLGGLPFVLTAHEGSAGFAADVMGRLTGAPGLCIATLGPGATNLTTGVGDAYLDRSPLLAITCNVPTPQLGRRIQMAIDHHTLFRPITKASLALRHGQVAGVLAEALEIALSEPVGPVHLDLPEDVAVAEATEGVPPLPSPWRRRPKTSLRFRWAAGFALRRSQRSGGPPSSSGRRAGRSRSSARLPCDSGIRPSCARWWNATRCPLRPPRWPRGWSTKIIPWPSAASNAHAARFNANFYRR